MMFSLLILLAPAAALAVVRAWGPLSPLTAVAVAILGEAAGLAVMRLRLRWLLAHPEYVPNGAAIAWSATPPSWPRRLSALALFSLYASLVAAIFLLGQWGIGRLTGAWSGRGV